MLKRIEALYSRLNIFVQIILLVMIQAVVRFLGEFLFKCFAGCHVDEAFIDTIFNVLNGWLSMLLLAVILSFVLKRYNMTK
ncbi:hypothetical protein EV696_1214 [Permianibacter aggregans]|uniref:Uncharacterized protein n=1 Tax=Permianibacter aggregans TaxID=1510150 RepID=A0A4R6UGC6_9GAMM|nr:hypothetical protein EV696_1214 [Permianibacter aggregans]